MLVLVVTVNVTRTRASMAKADLDLSGVKGTPSVFRTSFISMNWQVDNSCCKICRVSISRDRRDQLRCVIGQCSRWVSSARQQLATSECYWEAAAAEMAESLQVKSTKWILHCYSFCCNVKQALKTNYLLFPLICKNPTKLLPLGTFTAIIFFINSFFGGCGKTSLQ